MKNYNSKKIFNFRILIFFILIILKTTAFTQIILIEGSPRSGKTTVARLLNEKLSDSMRFSVDEYITTIEKFHVMIKNIHDMMEEEMQNVELYDTMPEEMHSIMLEKESSHLMYRTITKEMHNIITKKLHSIMYKLIAKKMNHSLTKEVFNESTKEMCDAIFDIDTEEMHWMIRKFVERNKTVIFDTNGYLRYYQEVFPNKLIFSVHLSCHPIELFKRTIEANTEVRESGNGTERDLVKVIKYFIHRYECTLERNRNSLFSLSIRDVTDIISEFDSDTFTRSRGLESATILSMWAFGSHIKNRVFIQPKENPFHLIIDTTKYNPQQCANIIKMYHERFLSISSEETFNVMEDFQYTFN